MKIFNGRFDSLRSTLCAATGILICASFCQSAELLVRTDTECRLNVDGAPQGTVRTGDTVRLTVSPGEHRIEAVSVDGAARWQKTIQIASARERQSISIPLRAAAANPVYWVDPETHLMWAAADNGLGLSRSQAIKYCRQTALGGFKDWVLPSIDELQSLFGGDARGGSYHIKGPLKLTGWQWSSSAGKQDGEGWAFDFGDGGRASVADGDSGLNRALCVRHSD